jgi:hypothetical protein
MYLATAGAIARELPLSGSCGMKVARWGEARTDAADPMAGLKSGGF